MSTKQLVAEIERGIKALQKAHALCLKAEAVAPKAKATAAKTAKVGYPPDFPELTWVSASGGMRWRKSAARTLRKQESRRALVGGFSLVELSERWVC
jgi:hypothetical protein